MEGWAAGQAAPVSVVDGGEGLGAPAPAGVVVVGGVVAAAGQLRGAQVLAPWRRLQCRALSRAHAAVAWQVVHGALLVGGLRLRVDARLAAAQACCQSCAEALRPAALESLTHAFMDCPDVAAAMDWLLAVYGALAGEQVPRDPLVVLADAHWRWQPAQPRLWLHLRVAYLGCVWAARQRGVVSPGGVAEAVVTALRHGVQRDWRRVQEDVVAAAAGVVPTVWFRGMEPRLQRRRFDDLWPAVGGWFVVGALGTDLVVRLSLTWPVLAPQLAQPMDWGA